VAEQLGFRLYDRELVQLVATDAEVSADLIAALDDEAQASLHGHVDGVFARHDLEPAEHVRHLVRVVSTIAAHGGVVIVGRAAAIFLDRATTVAARIDAPFTLRMTRVQAATGLDDHDARAEMVTIDDERVEFVKKHFQLTSTDPLQYDLVLNTARMDFAAAAATITALTRAKFPRIASG
jgi:cytidylate kinase